MHTSIAPFAVPAGEGTKLETPTGAQVHIKAHTRNTDGSLTVIEHRHQPRKGPPLHTHSREDEVWYVLEGDYRFTAGDDMFRLSEGGMAFGPRGTPHCFQNISDAPGRLLVFTTPSGVERYFEEFAELPPGPVDPQAHAAVARASGIELVGPPLEVSDPL